MKRRLRLALIGLILVLVGGMAVLLARGMRAQWRQEGFQSGLDLLPNVAQRIQDFHRIETQDGRKVWEVAAREAQYLEEEGEVIVTEPMVRLYLKDGGAVGLSGTQGRVVLDGRHLRRVELTGGIEVQFEDYTLRTERATYRRATDRISSPRKVEITGRALALSGERMEVDVGKRQLRLLQDVTMTLRREPGDDRPVQP